MGARQQHRAYCRFCVALCGVVVTTEDEQVVTVRGDGDHPLSQGYTCPKGRSLASWHDHPRRLDHPQLRRAGKGDGTWDEVLDDLAARTRTITAESGPDAVGMYLGTGAAFDSAGRRLASKFVRTLGSRSVYTSATVDAPAKPLVAELVGGNPGLTPAIDYERVTLTILVGVNPVVSHGHITGFPNPRRRLRDLADSGELWVVDPRRTETARLATHHLAPHPGTDHVWLAAIIRELLRDGVDLDVLGRRASGIDALIRAVEPFDLDIAAARCGVEREELVRLADSIRWHGRLAAQTGTGTTMSAGANLTEWLVWVLQILTDSLDRPGGTWFNPGYLRAMETKQWQASDGRAGPGPASRPELPQRNGELPCAALTDEIESGNLRALFVVGGNPIIAIPDTGRLAKALSGLEVLAVADVVETETTELATHVLPCAGQLERADLPHMTDTYQPAVATQYSPAVLPLAAERKPMWWTFAQLAERMDVPVLPDGADPDRLTDDDILEPIAARGRASLDEIKRHDGPIVHPEPVFDWVSERVLPEEGWRLAPAPLVEQLASLEDPDRLVLVPRRQLHHVNSQMADTGAADGRQDEPTVLVHPADAAQAGITEGSVVRVRTSNGELYATAVLAEDVRQGAVSIPHGFGQTNVNRLTSSTSQVDPLTGMVLLSGVPVSLTPA